MSFPLALFIFAAGIASLFYLDRDKRAGNSNALWLPVIWLWIIGSRPVSAWLAIWFGLGLAGGQGLDAQLDGSPLDAWVFMGLLAVGVRVLLQRKRRTVAALKTNAPVLIYFIYALLSCTWSPFPDVAFKRWIKDVGDLVMVLLVATDPEPVEALRRLFSRVGFILLPSSILLIRYSSLGRVFGVDGSPANVGVTTNKNLLGLIAYVISVGALWSVVHLLRATISSKRNRQLVAQGILIAFGVYVLQQAHSATSSSCFGLGAFLIIATSLPFFRRSPKRVHAFAMAILVLGATMKLTGWDSAVVGAMGKDPTTLGDRTKIWHAVIPVCPNPLLGAGFESFWNGYGKYVTEGLSRYERGLNTAHNGYIEVYLNLGFVGLGLIAMLLISGYQQASVAFRLSPEVGGLMLAYLATVAIYSATEAGYRIMTPTWISLLLVLVGSRTIASSVGWKLAPALPKPRPAWPFRLDREPVLPK